MLLPEVVVGHSMGGNILYDIFTFFRPGLNIDVFVTVGSQVSVFEELKLFEASDQSIPAPQDDRIGKPTNVGCWLNVFDQNDVFGVATARVFRNTAELH